MPSTPQQIAAARAAKQAENQANRDRKRAGASTQKADADEIVPRKLTRAEAEVSAAVVAELHQSLTQKGEKHADELAQSTKFWMDWSRAKFPKYVLERFAAAEAQRNALAARRHGK